MNTITRNTLGKPWYRERWPWLLMAGPFAVIVAGSVTAWLAVSSYDGLVDDDYYKQGLAVSQRVARDHRALELGINGEVVMQAEGGTREPELRVFLRANPGFVPPDQLALHVTHPTKKGLDQLVDLRAIGTGLYAGRLSAPISGRWRFSLEDTAGEWRLVGDWNPDREASLSLPAPPRSAKPPITYKGE